MLAAEYLIMPFYVAFWLLIIVLVFPDDRLTLAEVKEIEREISLQVPDSCTFMAQTAFFPNKDDAKGYMAALGASCGGRSNTFDHPVGATTRCEQMERIDARYTGVA